MFIHNHLNMSIISAVFEGIRYYIIGINIIYFHVFQINNQSITKMKKLYSFVCHA